MASTINASTSAGVITTADTSGILQLQTAGTTALSIDASQNVSFTNQPTYSGGTANGVAYLNGPKVLTTGTALVFDGTNLGVGTSSPTNKISANGTVAIGNQWNGDGTITRDSIGLYIGTTSGSTTTPIVQYQANTYPAAPGYTNSPPSVMLFSGFSGGVTYNNFIKATPGAGFSFHTGISGSSFSDTNQRVTITSGGDLLVGTTSALFSGANRQFVVNNSGGYAAGFGNNNAGNETVCIQNADTTGTRRFVVFKAGTSGVGEISSNGSTTTYGTSSDYRLKENIQPMTGALFTVSQLKPCTYTWKADGSAGEGFIAHELAEVCPHAVTGEKDAVNEDGSIKSQGIDTSFLVATLTAAIQEQQALIQTLTDRITALENK